MDALGVADQVVLHVAEVLAGPRIEGQAGLAVVEAAQGLQQGDHRATELEHLPLEAVDALGGVGLGGREHLGLHLLDVDLEARDHGRVVVHDPIGDRVQHRAGPQAEQVGVGLQVLAHVVQGAALPVSHGDDEVRADEHQHLADLDQLVVVHVARGLQHQEQRVAVHLQLGSLVGVHGVLDRQRVKAEVLPDLVHHSWSGIVQPDPHKALAAPRRLLECGLELDSPAQALAGVVQAAVDHRGADFVGARSRGGRGA